MSKRFTATEKWDDPWYRKLPCEYRDLWQFILDRCDNSGVWIKDLELASFCIGKELDEETALDFINEGKDRVTLLNEGSYWLVNDFIKFQFGELHEASRVHQHVLSLIDKHRVSKGYPKGMDRVKDKDKDKDKKSITSNIKTNKEIKYTNETLRKMAQWDKEAKDGI